MSEYTITANEKECDSYITAIKWTQGFDTSGTELDEDCLRECVIDCLAFFSCAWAYLSDEVIIFGYRATDMARAFGARST